MPEIREQLTMVDAFSGPLNNYTQRLDAASRASRSMAQGSAEAARTVGEAWRGMGEAAAGAARLTARNQEYVLDVQQQTVGALGRSRAALSENQGAAQMYAQAVAQAQNEVNRHRMALQMEHAVLQQTVQRFGAGSVAAREQAQAVNGAATALERCEQRARAYQVAMDQTVGSVRQASAATDQFRESADRTASSASGLIGQLRSLAGAYLGLRGLGSLVGASDSMVQTGARLDLLGGGYSQEEMQKMIYASAQRSRGDYGNTADMVAKMGIMAGESFGGTEELIAFSETLNKMYTISGTNLAGQKAATLQLQQAMAMGVLRGQEFRSVVQQVPMLIQSIASYLDVSTGKVKEMADAGLLTADVVKNAMFAATADINAKFETMPMTWGQVWTSMKNTALMATQPVLKGINWLANNIAVIGPMVLAVGGAFAIFQVAAHWTQISAFCMGLFHTAQAVVSIGFGVLSGNATAASAAVLRFNSAMLASPITWVVMGVTLLIGALYAGVAVYNKLTGASVSATGIIAGSFTALGAAAFNQFIVPTQNGFADFANFLGNVFHDPVAATKILFYGMADTVLGYISSVAHGIEDLINKIPGMHVSITAGMDGLRSRVQAASQSAKDASGWKEYVKRWEYKDLSSAFAYGYDKGANFNPLGDLLNPADIPGFDNLAQNIGSIAGDVGKIAQKLFDEDLKYLEDVAVRRYETRVNTTSLTPSITVNVGAGAERGAGQDIAAAIADILARQAASHAELSWQGV